MKIGTNLPDIGHQRIFLDEIESTQDFAAGLLKHQTQAHGLLITANHQTKGRGRLDKSWLTQKNQNFMGSVIITPLNYIAPEDIGIISMLTAVVLKQTINKFISSDALIKWPNDILIESKKVAGILIQNQWRGTEWQASILGIGVNLNQTIFHPSLAQAASLKSFTAIDIDKNEFINLLMQSLDLYFRYLINGESESIINEYHSSLFGIEEKVSFLLNNHEYFGQIKSVNKKGLINISSSLGDHWYDMDQIKINY